MILRLSLGTRTVLVVFAVLLPLTAILGYITYRSEKAQNLAAVIQDAADFGDAVDGVIHAAMLNEDPGSVAGFVERMEGPEEIVDIVIYNGRGNPAFSDPEARLSAQGTEVLRSREPAGAELIIGGDHAYRSFRPIEVGPECFQCHFDSEAISGVIQTDLSLAAGYSRLTALRNHFVAQSVVLGGSLGLVLWMMLSLTLVRPLRALREGAQRVTRGDLNARIEVRRRDEVGDVAQEFNLMAAELQRRIEELEDAQEKLHSSIHRVAEALSSALDVRSIKQILLSESMAVADFEFGAIVLVGGGSFCLAPAEGPTTVEKGAKHGRTLRSLECHMGALAPMLSGVARARTLYRSADMGFETLEVPGEWETLVLVPMVAEGVSIGHLILASSKHVEMDLPRRRALEFLGTQGATAVVHSRLHEQAQEMAVTDGLTGLSDHRHFYERLEVEMARAARHGLPLSLILFDLDHSKEYNDSVGHRGGDQVLRRVAAILRATVREADVVARYGGEEFAVILPHTGPEEAARLADRLRASVESELFPQLEGSLGGRVTLSAGVASLSRGTSTVEALVEAADRSMYAAKSQGRNRVVSASDAAGAGALPSEG